MAERVKKDDDASEEREGRLNREAFDAGARARREGQGDGVPQRYAQHRPLKRAWREGWESAGPRAPVPEIVHQDPPIVCRPDAEAWAKHGPKMPWPGDPRFWPEDRPLPTHYVRPPIPCKNQACRRVLTDTSGRAVLVQAVNGDIAHLLCGVCGTSFKLPVQR